MHPTVQSAHKRVFRLHVIGIAVQSESGHLFETFYWTASVIASGQFVTMPRSTGPRFTASVPHRGIIARRYKNRTFFVRFLRSMGTRNDFILLLEIKSGVSEEVPGWREHEVGISDGMECIGHLR